VPPAGLPPTHWVVYQAVLLSDDKLSLWEHHVLLRVLGSCADTAIHNDKCIFSAQENTYNNCVLQLHLLAEINTQMCKMKWKQKNAEKQCIKCDNRTSLYNNYTMNTNASLKLPTLRHDKNSFQRKWFVNIQLRKLITQTTQKFSNSCHQLSLFKKMIC